MFDVGSRIRYMREKFDKSAKEIALSASISPSFLSSIENNKKKCSIDNLENICNAIGITLAQFFNDKVDDDVNPDIILLVEKANQLNRNQINLLIDMADNLIQQNPFFIHCPHCNHELYFEKSKITEGQCAFCCHCGEQFVIHINDNED